MWLLRLHKNFDEVRCFQIPTSLEYEVFVFEFYLLVLVHILDKEFGGRVPDRPPANQFEVFAVAKDVNSATLPAVAAPHRT